MVGGQRLNGLAKPAQVLVLDADSKQPAVFLHHSDASAPVRRIDHELHGAVAREDVTQRAKADVRVAQVVKDACANDLVERFAELRDALDRESMEAQILDAMLLLKIAG